MICIKYSGFEVYLKMEIKDTVLTCLTTKWIMHLLFITNFTNRLFWLLIEFHSNLEGVGNHMLHVLWYMYYKPTYRGHVNRLIWFYFMDNVLDRYELGLSAIISALSITQSDKVQCIVKMVFTYNWSSNSICILFFTFVFDGIDPCFLSPLKYQSWLLDITILQRLKSVSIFWIF